MRAPGALGDLPARSIGIGQVAVHINGRQAANLEVGQRTKLVTRGRLLVSQTGIEAALRQRLAGDAAHIHSPSGGQGMNTGPGDTENLALVCAGRAEPALLDSYEAECRPIATEMLAATSGMTRLILGDTAPARLVRDHVFMPLLNRPWVQRPIGEHASQLKISYQRGPFPGQWFIMGPRRGGRIPDLACEHVDGRNTRLHAELDSRWVLLTSDRLDACGTVARKHLGEQAITVLVPDSGPAGNMMLVRPDAHRGWRGASAPDVLDRRLTGIPGR